MSANMHKLNDVIEHYKRHINRATEANDNDKIMKCISKLSRLPITVQNLQKTGIGRVVNSLRKYEGIIGESAKSLVIQWKNVVKIEESENFYQKDDNSDEEHQDISNSNDNEELQINQSITSSVASTSYYNNNYSHGSDLNDEQNCDSSGHESSHRHHDKSKYKKSKKDKDSKKDRDSKKDKDSKKRKESISTSTDDQGNEHVSKKAKKEHKYESIKPKKEVEKCEIPSTSNHENHNSSEENIKKDKKSSHSDKKKDKHRSSHKSESKTHKDKHESKTSHKDKSSDKSDSKKKIKENIKEEPKPSTSTTPSSSKTFEEALLGIEIGKKKQAKSKYRDRSSRSSSLEKEPSPNISCMKLAPLNLDPEELIANYKPLPQLDVKKKKTIDDIDPLASIMTTKNMRTKVFSGNKSTIYSEVPRLLDICVQTIKENLDALEYTGGVPFSILEPILKHANPDQLYALEHYNNYLVEDTGGLWKFHCSKEFRNKLPNKSETWRDFYIRCLEEREMKLARLRQNINANQAASTPVRKTQLAYVDTAVKPPRGVARKQAKFNTASESKRNILNKSMMGGHSTAEALTASNRSTTMATGTPIAMTSSHSQSSSALKKKKAPLMQKALQLVKSARRR